MQAPTDPLYNANRIKSTKIFHILSFLNETKRKQRGCDKCTLAFFFLECFTDRVLAIFNTFENVEDYKDFFFHPKKLFFYKTFRAGLFLGSRFFFSGGVNFFPEKNGFSGVFGCIPSFLDDASISSRKPHTPRLRISW